MFVSRTTSSTVECSHNSVRKAFENGKIAALIYFVQHLPCPERSSQHSSDTTQKKRSSERSDGRYTKRAENTNQDCEHAGQIRVVKTKTNHQISD
jgi:hypothetical protein